jgi:hypothetical protein
MDFFATQFPQTVTNLKLTASLSNDNYYQLAKRNLSLTTFYVKGIFASDAATTFLKSISPTLKHFHLERVGFNQPVLKFPEMKEVETATLSHYPLNCTFEKYFPKLKVLDLSCMRFETLSCILSRFSCTSSITTLTLPRLRAFYDNSMKTAVELVGRIFDKLTTLVVFDTGLGAFNNAEILVMREVFGYIRHIESLTIVLQNSNAVFLDYMLTGLTITESVPKYPSLVSLTKLKTLMLKKDPIYEGKIYITDSSVDFAFMCMPSLKSVTVRGLGFYPTPSCVSRLRDKGTTIEIHN